MLRSSHPQRRKERYLKTSNINRVQICWEKQNRRPPLACCFRGRHRWIQPRKATCSPEGSSQNMFVDAAKRSRGGELRQANSERYPKQVWKRTIIVTPKTKTLPDQTQIAYVGSRRDRGTCHHPKSFANQHDKYHPNPSNIFGLIKCPTAPGKNCCRVALPDRAHPRHHGS